MNKLQTIINAGDINGYSDAGSVRKEMFHKEAQRILKKIAKDLNLAKADFKVRSNKSGIAGSGDICLHSNTFYVTVSEPNYGMKAVMYRTCKGLTDYKGGNNQWTDTEALYDGTLVEKLSRM
ncbi:hypothetical protein [Photobacterium kishitanii]|uniref:Uncharacterized protein n=1 Tax=Photobacterium kishitanii TaxID=318456 RepID=A0A2T3KL27_9GAMM|nr:hypothetical protein [Photobacterium kishitanii]PSV00412.1 hypothetical protein C9J27_04590 [Photobacterium kishitanii]